MRNWDGEDGFGLALTTGPAPRRKGLGEKFNDWVRGGAYTNESSEHNAMLYEREKTPMLRWRMVGAFNLFLIIGLSPIQILILGVPEFFKEVGGTVQSEWQRVTSGKLY